jgi:hypothetical protein
MTRSRLPVLLLALPLAQAFLCPCQQAPSQAVRRNRDCDGWSNGYDCSMGSLDYTTTWR